MTATADRQLILASTSPRRRELLGRLGVPFDVMDPGEEPEPDDDDTDGIGHARRMAEFKAAAAVRSLRAADPDWPRVTTDVLASDTVVQLDHHILGKPTDRDDAIRILTSLSGSTHHVASSLCLHTARPDAPADGSADEVQTAVDVTHIVFRPLTREEIVAYVDSGESFGKAGAYAVQERGDRFVANIDGEFTTVVGLPLPLVAEWLASRGYPVRRP